MVAGEILDRDRFAKCLALANGGATEGERAAGRAAAVRIAAAAGLTLAEAVAIMSDRQPASAEPEPRPPPRDRGQPQRTQKPVEPITLEELLAQRAAALRRKKAAAAHKRRMAKELAEQAAQADALRRAQDERDRAWAEEKARRGSA